MFQNIKETLRQGIVKLNPRSIYYAGKLFGSLAYIFALKYRRIVQANLQFAFPAWNEGEVKHCALKVFQNYAMTFMEVLKMCCCRTEAEISSLVDFGDLDSRRIFSELEKHSVINISAHIGNWEAALQAATAHWHLPTSVVVQKIHNKKVNRFFEWFRSRFGVEVIYKRDAVKAMQRVLKNHRFLIMLVDQSRSRDGIPITFFGKKAYATPAVATLALRYKVPVYAVYCVRNQSGRLQFHYSEPIILQRSGDLKADVSAYTQQMHDVLEQIIREYPEQWFWFHKKWRSNYRKLYQSGPVFGKNAPQRFDI